MEHLIRLQAEIAAAQARVWRWGEHDCVTFAARAVGLSLPWRWDSARAAARLLRQAGGMRAAVSRVLDRAPGSAILCRPGDVALCDGAVGVVVDTRAAFAAPVGVAFVPLARCETGWRR